MSTASTSIENLAASVRTKADFTTFAREFAREVTTHPEDWENATLERYLEAFAAWTQDMDGYFTNNREPIPAQPSWELLAKMLLAARVYE